MPNFIAAVSLLFSPSSTDRALGLNRIQTELASWSSSPLLPPSERHSNQLKMLTETNVLEGFFQLLGGKNLLKNLLGGDEERSPLLGGQLPAVDVLRAVSELVRFEGSLTPDKSLVLEKVFASPCFPAAVVYAAAKEGAEKRGEGRGPRVGAGEDGLREEWVGVGGGGVNGAESCSFRRATPRACLSNRLLGKPQNLLFPSI